MVTYNTGGRSKRAVGSGAKTKTAGKMRASRRPASGSRLRTMRPKSRKLGRS